MTFEERHGIDRDLLKQAVAAAERDRLARLQAEQEKQLLRLGLEFRSERANDGRSKH